MTLTDAERRRIITALHGSGRKAALAITGGGSGAIGALLRIPGGSRLLLEAQVPYDTTALSDYLGAPPEQFCSAETAVAMARAALTRAEKFGPDAPVVGLGATAALASDRPKKGEHRFHIATATTAGVAHCTGVLAKGRRDRAGEEDLLADVIVVWLARACGVDAPALHFVLDADEHVSEETTSTGDAIDDLLAGRVARVTAEPHGPFTTLAPPPRVLLPGSFNPVHDGHLRLAHVAEDWLGAPLSFEISVTNVDKPPLSAVTIRARLQQFAGARPVELTRAPTFVEKARIFPGATFVIGADTAMRLFVAKYYGGETAMQAALDEIMALGCRFLVAVRADTMGRLLSLADIAVPSRYEGLFTEIPEARFRLDTSSTAIRSRGS